MSILSRLAWLVRSRSRWRSSVRSLAISSARREPVGRTWPRRRSRRTRKSLVEKSTSHVMVDPGPARSRCSRAVPSDGVAGRIMVRTDRDRRSSEWNCQSASATRLAAHTAPLGRFTRSAGAGMLSRSMGQGSALVMADNIALHTPSFYSLAIRSEQPGARRIESSSIASGDGISFMAANTCSPEMCQQVVLPRTSLCTVFWARLKLPILAVSPRLAQAGMHRLAWFSGLEPEEARQHDERNQHAATSDQSRTSPA